MAIFVEIIFGIFIYKWVFLILDKNIYWLINYNMFIFSLILFIIFYLFIYIYIYFNYYYLIINSNLCGKLMKI